MKFDRDWKWILAIVLAGFLVYANALGGSFVYDDNRQIGRNPLIQNLSLAGAALTSDVWAFKGDGKYTASNYWRPTFVSWMILNYRVFGLNPFGWHVTNILLHLGVCVLGFLLLRRFGFSDTPSFVAALLFAVHPVHAESVAWISGSTDLLFALCLLASLWFAENRRRGGNFADLALSMILYALALGSKEVAIACLPVYYILFSRTEDDGFRLWSPAALRATAGFVLVAGVYFAARWAVLGAITRPVENPVPLADAFFSIPTVFVFYLKQLVFPYTLSINYPLRATTGFDFFEFILPLLVTLAVAGVVILLARRDFRFLIGAALFFLPLVAAFNLTAFPADQIVHDRYLYLSVLGFLMMILAAAGDRLSARSLLIAAAVLAVPLSIATFAMNRVWSSDLTLWTNAAAVDPQSASTMSQYGSALAAAGKPKEAVDAFNAALEISPNPGAFVGRAQALIATERFEEAVWDLQTVTEMKNDNLNAYTLYQAYEGLAVALQQKNDLVRAARYLREARKRLPIYYAALTEKIAVIEYSRGNKDEALKELEEAKDRARKELLMSSKAVFFRLGLLYAEKGNQQAAKEAFQEFMKLTATASDAEIIAERKMAADALKKL